MKIINLDKIYKLYNWKKSIEFAIEVSKDALTRKRSEAEIKKEKETLNGLENYKEKVQAKIDKLTTEANEAKQLFFQGGYEAIFITKWTNDYGRLPTKTIREKIESIEEAEVRFTKLKEGNGNYVEIIIEVKEQGTQEKVENFSRKLKNIKNS